MIVCHCKAVSDRSIREAVQRGARSPREVLFATKAGRSCGGCLPALRELLARETRQACPLADTPAAAAG